MNKLDKQGEAARDLYKKITTEVADYNERRKEQTVILRDALTPVWAALKSGTPVNGQTTIEGWCKWANPTAKYPERQFQKIMSEGEVSSPRPKIVTVKPDGFVRIGTLTFKVKDVDAIQGGNTGHYNLHGNLQLVNPKTGDAIEEPIVVPPKKKKKPKYYETDKTPIVEGETIVGVNRFGDIKVWAPAPFDSTDGSRLWLVERLKDGTPHIWRSCDINRLRRGLEPKVNKCEMWYRHSDTREEVAAQMEMYFKPAMAWAEKTLKHLKEQAATKPAVAPTKGHCSYCSLTAVDVKDGLIVPHGRPDPAVPPTEYPACDGGGKPPHVPKKRKTAAQKTDLIKVKLTPAQMENTFTVLATFRDDKRLALNRSTISFDAATYQEVAKQVLMRLEQRKAALKKYHGAAQAIEGATRKIAFGDLESDAPERSVEDWLDQYQDEQDDAHWQKKEAEIAAAPSSVTVIIDESDQVEGD